MRITWNELAIDFAPERSAGLLDEWRWLIGANVHVVMISAIGDLFLEDAEGNILWLDAGAARITRVAQSASEFKRLMQQTANAAEWFVPQLIGDLIVSGKRLAPGQCYSYRVPPMLSGKMELENFEPTDLLVHCSILGQIGRQIRDLPAGTKIDGISPINENG